MNAFKSSLIATTIALALGVSAVAAQDTAAAPERTAGQVVDDATITSHIKRIRRKFQALDPAFDDIDTVHGAGYRWRA